MASSSRHTSKTSKTRSTLLDDLDLQPVREVRGRILNEVPHDYDSAPSSPKVKFNYVEVTLPKPPKGCDGHEKSDSDKRIGLGKASKKDMDAQKDRGRRSQDVHRNADEGKRQFATHMLSRGVPVWEEVSEEERNSRFIGGTNPFRCFPGSRDTANITSRNTSKNTSKVPSAVWEDVSKTSSISQSIPKEDDFISDDSAKSVIEGEFREGCHLHKSSTLHESSYLQKANAQEPHMDQVHFTDQQQELLSNSSSHLSPSSPLQCSNTQDNSPVQDLPHKPLNEPVVLDGEPSHDVMEQMDDPPLSAVGMKRKFGGHIEENEGTIITTKSWRIGEQLARKRYGPLPRVPLDNDQKDKGEEEKHERESTRESRNKRDLSASSRAETQPSKSRQKLTSKKDEDEVQWAPKTPPRIRNYKPEEIQKYMEGKRSERMKSLKEQKIQRQLEKTKREERLKELAVKTKELAHTGKKQAAADQGRNCDSISKREWHTDNQQWGCPSDCQHETTKMAKKIDVQSTESLQIPVKSQGNNERSEQINDSTVSGKVDVKTAVIKKTRRDGKKRKKKRTLSLSDSDSISEIVSRTLEECERQVRSSSISLESISSSSVSLSSSDTEMKSSDSQSSTSSFDMQQKQRVISLGKMAQTLTSQIEREEENLVAHAGKIREGEPDTSLHKSKISKRGVKEIAPRETLSYSEIQTLSVDELIARMTAMLPQNATRIPARAEQVLDPAGNARHNDVSVRSIQTVMTPQLLHQKLRENQQRQQQAESFKNVLTAREDIPDLMPPEIPTLQLSGGSTVKSLKDNSDPKIDTIVSLHGYKVPAANEQIPQKNTNLSVPFHFTSYSSQNQSEMLGAHLSGRRKMMEKAALKIQSLYRGYCVRKVTSAILGKRSDRTVSRASAKSQNIVTDQSKWQQKAPQKTFFKNQDLHMTSSSDECNEVDWRKIRSELESKSYVPKREVPYIFKKTDLPEWIKPYVILSETGNIENFIDSKVKVHEVAEQVAGNGKQVDSSGRNNVNNDSDKENVEVLDNTDMDATLTEGLISESDKKDVYYVLEKETQTNMDGSKSEKKKKEKSKDQKNQKLIKEQDKNVFVDLKKTFTGEKTLLLSNVETSGNREIEREATALHPKTIPAVLKSNNPEKMKALKSRLNNSEKHEVTLESGPLEEESPECMGSGESSASASESDKASEINLEEGEILESSEAIDTHSSDILVDEEMRAPHELLGRGPHFGPASLRLRLNAELMYQDTLGEALSQLRDAEQLQIISKSNQEAIAYSQALSLEHQVRLAEEHRQKEEKKKIEERRKDEEIRRRKEEEERKLKDNQNRHQEALLSVQRMEKEAKDRMAQLEKEVRAQAEQILSSTKQMTPQVAGSQPDVIAAAAVAAVGATISQWERLRPIRGGSNSGLESSAVILSQGPISSSMRDSHQYTSSFTGSSSERSRSRVSHSKRYSSSNKSSYNKNQKSSNSERIRAHSVDKTHSSVIENLPSSNHSATTKSSVDEQFSSAAESSRSSLSEEVDTEMSVPTVSHRKSSSQSQLSVSEEEGLGGANTSQDKAVSEEVSTEMSVCAVGHRKSSQSHLSITEEEGLRATRTSPDKSVSEEVDCVQSSKASKSGSETLISTQTSRKEGTFQSQSTDKEVSKVTEDIPMTRTGSQEVMEDIAGTSANVTSNLTSSTVRESLHSKSGTQISEVQSKDASYSGSNQEQESIMTSEYSRQSVTTSKSKSTPTSTSKSHSELTHNESKEKSDIYSESFEVESGSESSSSSAAIPSQSKKLKDYNGDLSMVVTSASILTAMDQIDYTTGGGFPSGVLAGGGGSALGMTLNMMESMQKEEELRHQHQRALLKLQEQSLIEEARWKLAALQSEGGPGIRKKQRAVLLQLREQRAHLRRLIETQNLAAQQRRLLLLQHYHLLATTNGAAALGGRGYVATSRGQSPNPTSPRLTPRMMEVNISSSSESQDDMSLHLSLKGKDAGSSSPSDCGSREKRRSHSEERKRINSIRLQEKRRVEMDLLQQQLLQEEKEILRLKNQDKDASKVKRKGEVVSRRSRDKKEKSPTSSSPLADIVQDSVSSTGSSVPEESVDASAHDSQSSVPEEGVCHSDAASSISEQEVGNLRSKQSVPVELVSTRNLKMDEEPWSKNISGSGQSSSRTIQSDVESSHISEDVSDASTSKYTKSMEIKSGHQTMSSDSKNFKSNERSSIRTILSDGKSKITERVSSTKLDDTEKPSKSTEAQSTVKSGSLVSEIQTQSRTDATVSENASEQPRSHTASISSQSGNELSHVSESKSGEGRSCSQKFSSSRALPLPLRVPLSPRSPHKHHRRYSSESDDSFTLSQTETASDISDGEGKLLALKEQLASRRAEAERLRREKRRLRRERLASQEHALKQQISAYDSYIQQARLDLERESKELQQASMVRPLIKRPQVAETKKSRQSESILISPEKSDISETSIISEDAKSEKSDKTYSKSKDVISKASSTSLSRETDSGGKLQTVQPQNASPESDQSPTSHEVSENEAKQSVLQESVGQDPRTSIEDADPSRVSQPSSISEDYSFEEETATSEHSNEHASPQKSLSQDSSQDTDHSPSQASSTETIVQSPKKQDSGPKDEEESYVSEMSGLEASEVLNKSQDTSKAVHMKSCDEDKHKETEISVEHSKQESKVEAKGIAHYESQNALAESEKRLEIYIPIPDLGSQEGYDSSDQDKDTSMEGSIGEEVIDEHYEDSSTEAYQPIPFALEEKEQQKADEEYSDSHKSNRIAASVKDNEGISEIYPKIDSAEAVQLVEEDAAQAHSLRTQRLVDDISNNLLASMMKETSGIFMSILKERKTNLNESNYRFSLKLTEKDSPKADIASVSENKILVSSSSKVQTDDSPASSVSSNKSQILKRVNDLIAEGNTSPRSPSVSSPRQSELVLTPQLTFDLSPDILSPASSTPASPTKVSAGLDNRLPEKSASIGSRGSLPENEEKDSSLSPENSKGFNLDMAALTSTLLNIANSPDLDLDDKLGQIDGEDTEFSVEGIEGNWFDDDFWTSADNRKKQQQLKAEEERIAAEIARLEELQRLQEQYPGLVIREVPNKPPPPYTPPNSVPTLSSTSPPLSPTMPPAYSLATPREEKSPKVLSPANTISVPHRLSKADLRKLATEIFHVVPSRKEEVIPLVKDAFECLYEAWERGLDPVLVEPSEKFVSPSPTLSQNEDSSEEEEEGSAKIFRHLLFCLMREIVSDAYQQQHAPLPPPWIKQPFPPTKILLAVKTHSKSALYSYAQEQVGVLFGWSPTAKKESLMIRWARKHRDLVDQVLVRELQAEESSWTQYDEDEAAVKVQVASEIMDDLVTETATLFAEIIAKKKIFV